MGIGRGSCSSCSRRQRLDATICVKFNTNCKCQGSNSRYSNTTYNALNNNCNSSNNSAKQSQPRSSTTKIVGPSCSKTKRVRCRRVTGNDSCMLCIVVDEQMMIDGMDQLQTMYLPVALNFLYPFITLSIAFIKSFSVIALRLSRIANIPASVQTERSSAPVVLGHKRPNSS